MAYADLNTIQTIATGETFLAATLQQIRDNFEFLMARPSCSVKASAAQEVSSSTWTSLTADTENFDKDSMHDTSSNTERLTANTAGWYLVVSTVEVAASDQGLVRAVRLLGNGEDIYDGVNCPPIESASTFRTVVNVARTINLDVDDYIETQVFHDVGSAHDCKLLDFSATFLTR